MRAEAFERYWYGGIMPPWHLRLLAAGYGGATALRRGAYALGWLRRERLPVPVAVIGNLSVGGTGKTPLTIALVEALRARGWRPGVASRGYGGSATAPMRVEAGTDPSVAGDEPCLIRRSGVPVAIGRDRTAAARLLIDAGEIDVVLADDGLQHYRLMRDIDVCVIDGARRFGNGRLLPAGPLREPLMRLGAIDFRVCNGGEAQPGEVSMQLAADTAVALVNPCETQPLASFMQRRVHAVAGIGNPQRFFDMLATLGIDVVPHAFADHHAFRVDDFDFGDNAPVLMTEKDAIKCVAFAQQHWFSVPVRAVLPSLFLDAFAARLAAARSR